MTSHSNIFPQVIKNKFTGEPASYGFINFDSDPAALMAMHKLNGKIIPNSTPVSVPELACVSYRALANWCD